MAHKVKYVQSESYPPVHRGTCKCGWHTPWEMQRQSAEDAGIKHEQEMEQFRARMSSHPPSLRNQRDYYRQQAEDEGYDPEQRRLWQQLADEIDHRLNEATDPMEGQGTLPF